MLSVYTFIKVCKKKKENNVLHVHNSKGKTELNYKKKKKKFKHYINGHKKKGSEALEKIL